MSIRSLSAARPLVSLVGASRSYRRGLPFRVSGGSRETLPVRDGRVLLPTAEAVRGSGARCLSVIDKIQDRIQQRNVDKQENEFKKQMLELSELQKFDLNDFARIIEEPLQKWTAKMPWNSGREELLNMQKQKKLLDAMTPAQRSDPNLIKDRHKKAIADRAGCSLEEVHEVLYRFRELRGMHLWLRERRKRNQKIPSSTEEMAPLVSDREGVPLTKYMKQKVSKLGTGVSYSF